MSMLYKMLQVNRGTALLPRQTMMFASRVPDIPNQLYKDPNASKYQESRMLFFGKKSQDSQKVNVTKPKTI
jgi:hypothetical protein